MGLTELQQQHDALIACPSKSNEREQLAKCLVLLRFICPRWTQFGGLDEGRGRVGASSLAIALAVSLRSLASALMALCLLFRGGAVYFPRYTHEGVSASLSWNSL